MFLFFENLKNLINDKFIFKLLLNIITIFLFTIIYYNNREDFKVHEDEKLDTITEAIYLCLSIHTGLGLGDIIPKFDNKKKTGIKIIICHIIIVIISILL